MKATILLIDFILHCLILNTSKEAKFASATKTSKEKDGKCENKEHICAALVMYNDTVDAQIKPITINQGPYCVLDGCPFCAKDAPNPTALEQRQYGFIWRHQSYSSLKILYLRCAPDMNAAPPCQEEDIHNNNADNPKAQFITPKSNWKLNMLNHRCTCPHTYSLLSWRLQDNNWIYSYVCEFEQCQGNVGWPGNDDNVECAKEEYGEAGNDMEFSCSCPDNSFCDTEDPEVEKSKRSRKDGTQSATRNMNWYTNQTTGRLTRYRYCELYQIQRKKD